MNFTIEEYAGFELITSMPICLKNCPYARKQDIVFKPSWSSARKEGSKILGEQQILHDLVSVPDSSAIAASRIYLRFRK